MCNEKIKADLVKMEERGHARRLGHVENYFVLAQRQKLYAVFCFFAEFDKACSINQLTNAIRSICLENPILLSQVVPRVSSDPEAYYSSEEYLSKPILDHDYIRLAQMVRISDILINDQEEYTQTITKVLEVYETNGGRFTSELFDLLAPLKISICGPGKLNWRILALPDGRDDRWRKFVFISNHALKDGTSAANFFQDLRVQLNSQPTELEENDVVFDYSVDYEIVNELPKPIDQILDYRPSRYQVAKLIGNHMVRDSLGYKSPAPALAQYDGTDNDATKFHSYFINFTPAEVTAIRKEIKERVGPTCTMTPYLQACWFVSLYKSGKVFTKSLKEWVTDIMIPMYTPQLLPEDNNIRSNYRYGCNVGGTRYNYQISSFDVAGKSDKFWALVSYYHGVFQQSKVQNRYLHLIGMIMLDSVYQKSNLDSMVLGGLMNKSRMGSVLSNVGFFSLKGNPNDAYHLKDLFFAQTVGSFRFTFNLNVCSTDVGGMNIGASVAKGTFPERRDWQTLCDLFKTTVLES